MLVGVAGGRKGAAAAGHIGAASRAQSAGARLVSAVGHVRFTLAHRLVATWRLYLEGYWLINLTSATGIFSLPSRGLVYTGSERPLKHPQRTRWATELGTDLPVKGGSTRKNDKNSQSLTWNRWLFDSDRWKVTGRNSPIAWR